MSNCKTCDNVTSLTNVKYDSNQKKVLKQAKVSQSEYITNVSSSNTSINNNNEGVKYNSYHRYMAKKKGLVLGKNNYKISSKNCDKC